MTVDAAVPHTVQRTSQILQLSQVLHVSYLSQLESCLPTSNVTALLLLLLAGNICGAASTFTDFSVCKITSQLFRMRRAHDLHLYRLARSVLIRRKFFANCKNKFRRVVIFEIQLPS